MQVFAALLAISTIKARRAAETISVNSREFSNSFAKWLNVLYIYALVMLISILGLYHLDI